MVETSQPGYFQKKKEGLNILNIEEIVSLIQNLINLVHYLSSSFKAQRILVKLGQTLLQVRYHSTTITESTWEKGKIRDSLRLYMLSLRRVIYCSI